MKNNDNPVDAILLQRVLAQSPVGRQELRDPQSGLSLPQRWLLGQLDGRADLAALAARPGSPAAQRLPRDAAKLVHLGLAVDMGAAGPDMDSFGPTTVQGEITLELPLDADAGQSMRLPASTELPAQRRSPVSVLLAGAALLALGSAAAYFVAGESAKPASAAAAALAASATADAALPVAAAASPAVAAMPAPTATAESEAPTLLTVVPSTGIAPALPPSAAAARVPALAAAAPRPGVASASAGPTPAPALLPAAATASIATPLALPAVAPPVVALASAPVATADPAPAAVPPATAAALPQTQALPTPPAALRPVSVVEPSFPREGLGLGGRSVNLQARLTVDASGAVVAVNFVPSSAGTRSFERVARAALLQWRFPPGAGDRTYTQQLRFSEE